MHPRHIKAPSSVLPDTSGVLGSAYMWNQQPVTVAILSVLGMFGGRHERELAIGGHSEMPFVHFVRNNLSRRCALNYQRLENEGKMFVKDHFMICGPNHNLRGARGK